MKNEILINNLNNSQDEQIWTKEWKERTPNSEIKMWDYFGGRHWILKFVPRYGKVLEAGCGLGRYNFYLSKLGIDIDGLDFSKETIDYLNKWSYNNGFKNLFIEGNVLELPYEDNSLSGYISLGVIEHFIEGPQKVLREAFRVLRPGGIAIITTPGISFYIFIRNLKIKLKFFIKKILNYKITDTEFFQYWYSLKEVCKYIKESGLYLTAGDKSDLLYAFLEKSNFDPNSIQKGTFANWFTKNFENTFFRKFGAQNLTLSVKVEEIMYCFLCGEKKAKRNSLNYFLVPICEDCKKKEISNFYKINSKVRFAQKYEFRTEDMQITENNCEFCNKKYSTSDIFEDFGFTKKVCPECLKKPEINIILSNKFIKLIWRNRKN